MRKLLYLGFCLVLVAGFGCAITDYGIITDNNQVDGKGGADGKFGPNPVIDTKGKAHIQETSQVATGWPDGTDELLNFVDQKADGTAVLTTFNNFSSGNEPVFHDDLYCNTSRQGCSIFTAPDNNDANLFDGTWNQNCSGARSLSLLLSTGRYYGECGKLSGRGDKSTLGMKNELFNSAIFATRYNREGFLFDINSSTTNVILTNENGFSFNLPIRNANLWTSSEDNLAVLDLRNPLISTTLQAFADFLDRYATGTTNATVTYNGLSLTFKINGDSRQITAIGNRRF